MKPLTLHLQDQQYPFTGFSHTRPNARALLMNDKGLFAFHHIFAFDKFGQRDYLETPGGGLDPGETPAQAVIREVEEECGLKAEVITTIGVIEDAYHLIQRQNINHYFFLKVVGQGVQHWTPQEHTLIHALHWLTLAEAKAWYERLPDHGIAQLIKQRELPVVQWLMQYLQITNLK